MSLFASIVRTSRKYPILTCFQLLFAICIFPAFFVFSMFVAAVSPDEAASLGKPLPNDEWEAGVMSFGKYGEWWLPERHPFWFGLASAILLFILVFLIVSSIIISRKEAR